MERGAARGGGGVAADLGGSAYQISQCAADRGVVGGTGLGCPPFMMKLFQAYSENRIS